MDTFATGGWIGRLAGLHRTWVCYLGLIRCGIPFPTGCVLGTAISGLSEGIALLALAPVLEIGMGHQVGSFLGTSLLAAGSGFPKKAMLLGLATFTVLGTFSTLLNYRVKISIAKFQASLEERLRIKLASAVFHMDWQSYSDLKMGELAKAMLADATFGATGTTRVILAASSLIVVIVQFAIASFASPRSTFLVMMFVLLMVLFNNIIGKRRDSSLRTLSQSTREVAVFATEVFGHFKYFRSAGIGLKTLNKFHSLFGRVRLDSLATKNISSLTNASTELGGIACIAVLLFTSTIQMGDSLAQQLAFVGILYRIAQRLAVFHIQCSHAQEFQPWADAWRTLYEQAMAHAERFVGGHKEVQSCYLRFESVSFSYRGKKTAALSNVSFTIEPGKCTAIVGGSGSGKTTLLDIVSGLIQPTAGRVTIGGIPMSQFNLENWRGRLGVVSQECPILHTSILANIAWGDEYPDRSKAELCARKVHAWEFIEQLPNGLDTDVGSSGGQLSGGQRQLLAVARALYREPLLLIFDEPTSALDRVSEQAMIKALEELKGQVIMLLVTHRPSTARMADEVLVLHQGELVRCGSWETVLGSDDESYGRSDERNPVGVPSRRYFVTET
ncbi:MAG: ABC transporter ATP-binding protein [Deltaproteobacteria bacterium]|nr:ABC transporter ATP-binding protein [Deltaproteobacteria bacterium]